MGRNLDALKKFANVLTETKSMGYWGAVKRKTNVVTNVILAVAAVVNAHAVIKSAVQVNVVTANAAMASAVLISAALIKNVEQIKLSSHQKYNIKSKQNYKTNFTYNTKTSTMKLTQPTF